MGKYIGTPPRRHPMSPPLPPRTSAPGSRPSPAVREPGRASQRGGGAVEGCSRRCRGGEGGGRRTPAAAPDVPPASSPDPGTWLPTFPCRPRGLCRIREGRCWCVGGGFWERGLCCLRSLAACALASSFEAKVSANGMNLEIGFSVPTISIAGASCSFGFPQIGHTRPCSR